MVICVTGMSPLPGEVKCVVDVYSGMPPLWWGRNVSCGTLGWMNEFFCV